ncbi:MAG: EAL domain-containing protein [Clostridia bacterium]|nr:EAL domain-containing protein [Clostridia bacterium]
MRNKTVKNSQKRFGLATASLVIPFVAVLVVLIVFMAYFSININQTTNDLAEFMQKSNQYQQSATQLQAGSSVLSETATIFIQTPQIPNGPDTTTVNAEPLKAYAAELREDRRPAKILALFREYDVSDEILGYIEKAAADSEEMQRIQTHALSLIFSVYPLPDDAVYDSITLTSLTEEELAMPAEARLATAKKLVIEKNYSLLKSEASKQVELCRNVLQEQFNARCVESQDHLSAMRTALWAVTSLFVASLICALAIFYIWIIVPMRRYSKDIVSDRMLKKQGQIRELLSIATAYNGLMERRKKLEECLRQAAETDSLTGLQNRYYFDQFVLNFVQRDGLVCVLLFDVNYLKVVNDTKGHREGDLVICQTADAIKECFGDESGSNCYRVGGDEFAAVLRERTEEDVLKRIGNLMQMLEKKGVSVSVGYAMGVQADEQMFRRLMREADERMYENKKQYHLRASESVGATVDDDATGDASDASVICSGGAVNDDVVKRQYILENFERALAENWIRAYYQPIIRAINGKACNEEALARWVDPVKGVLPPVDFIPCLEDVGLIYKLDLFMLEQVLEHIKAKEAEGFYIVPHSINLSRSDFDSCDMVEEVRRRVDASGVRRDRICIEITESVVGSNYDYIKGQIERFRALGFPVWIDDFGSGYSSLDMLQSIKFDLVKFDRGFLQKMDENDDGRIILTELMKMTSALGVDVICEGVETEAQVRFLQEIGCSKLQGFFFSKPSPVQVVFEYHRANKQTGYENPDEAEYYQSLCGLNLYDVGVVARDENVSLENTYSTLPMCIIEVKGDRTRFVRTNQSYRDFFMRFFALDPSNLSEFSKYDADFMYHVVKVCCEQGVRTFYDEKMPDGSAVHSFARRIAVDPITGVTAIAIAVLSIREPDEKLTVDQILSVIEQFGEYLPGGFFIYKADGEGKLLYANKATFDIFGCDGPEDFKKLTGFTFRGMVHPEDYDNISASITEQIKDSQADLDYVEYRIVRKDGAIRRIRDYGHYVEYDDKRGLYYVFISDVTDRHE